MSTMFQDKNPNTPITASWLNLVDDMRFTSNQVVNSVAMLRLVSKNISNPYVSTLGYYGAGDGGNANFYCDLTDTTSADNGGTIIVGADGGRWKMYKQFGWVSIKQFGAKMDDATNDAPAVQAAVNWVLSQPVGGAVYTPTGIARLTTGINIPNTANKSFIMFGDGPTSLYRPAAAITMFTTGDATPQFGSNRMFSNFGIAQATVANVNAITLFNANSTLIEKVYFANVNNCVVLNSSYNVHIDKCQFYGSAANAITTLTTGTNGLFVTGCSFNTCVTSINLLVGGNNIVIQNCDLEASGIAIAMANYTSVKIDANYIENGTNVAFLFTGTNFAVDITQNWLGFNAVSTAIGNIVGGIFEHNTVYQSTWTESNTVDFIFGNNYIISGSVPQTRWRDVSSVLGFANGFTNTAGIWGNASWIKDEKGFVRLRGMIQAAANNVAFVLPGGYRPANIQNFPGVGVNGTLGNVQIQANGNVSVFRATDGTFDLSTVCFQAI